MNRRKKKKLFGNHIDPACRYCRHQEAYPEGGLRCAYRGQVEPDGRCARFAYDPLKREPRNLPELPTYDPKDFLL